MALFYFFELTVNAFSGYILCGLLFCWGNVVQHWNWCLLDCFCCGLRCFHRIV